jgi:hypothetical protein
MHPKVFRTRAPEANDELTSDPTQRWTLALTSVVALLVGLDALVVSTALSTIRTDLGASVEQLEWTVNAYVLTFAGADDDGGSARRSLRAPRCRACLGGRLSSKAAASCSVPTLLDPAGEPEAGSPSPERLADYGQRRGTRGSG